MGKVTIFTIATCPFCKRAKELLTKKNVSFEEISVSENPEWRPLLFLLTNGGRTVPKIFFNEKFIGGSSDLQALEEKGVLDGMLKEALEGPTPDFPPPLRKPLSQDFLQVLPKSLIEKWQSEMETLNTSLGGTPTDPISSLLLMLETPNQMVVVCTAGPGKEIYQVGMGGDKGHDGSEEKLYCQVAIERKETLFIDDPTKVPGLEKNEDWVKFGYGYYVGAPWVVGELRGTIVAMEKKPGILKPTAVKVIEAMRDSIEQDLKQKLQ